MSTNLILCILAIVVSIVVGWKLKFNTGIIAMLFAFVIGNCVMGLKVNAIIGYWPTTIVFYLISISLFFSYATINGTMAKLGKKLLYALGGNAKLIPIAIALVCAIVGGLGAGASTPAIVGPFAFIMAIQAGVDPTLTAVAIAFGNLVGSNNPFNGYGGVIGMNLVKANGIEDAVASQVGTYTWINSTIAAVIIIIVYYIIKKGFKAKKVQVEKPEAFTPVQKKTMTLILLAFVFMVVPALLSAWVKNPTIKAIAGFCQPQVIMIAGAVIAAFMHLADEQGGEKAVIKSIPINTVIMIVGVYMLIQVSVQAGLTDFIAGALSSSIPAWLVPGAIVFFAAFLSFFSSCTSTVMPLMYPLVPGLAAALGLNPVMLYSCIFFGGLSTAVSPFSTGGALTIASCHDNATKELLTQKMIITALVCPVITIIIAEIGLFGFFSV